MMAVTTHGHRGAEPLVGPLLDPSTRPQKCGHHELTTVDEGFDILGSRSFKRPSMPTDDSLSQQSSPSTGPASRVHSGAPRTR